METLLENLSYKLFHDEYLHCMQRSFEKYFDGISNRFHQ